MHIFEIIEPTTTDKQYKGSFTTKLQSFRKKTPHQQGDPSSEGKYSKVTPNRKDPHTVMKRPRTTITYLNDPFWEYIKLIKENKLWENPHFPRFYNITTIKDKNGVEMKKLEMEKLIHGDKLTGEQVDYLIDLYFVEKVAKSIKYGRKSKWMNLVYEIGEILTMDTDLKYIKDDTLRQAMDALGDIAYDIKISSRYDIHANNIMVRNTPYGPQIVFTDPFSEG